ncbi:hypothetical protein AYO45_04770 [Gammaproteobacteria bacterium SCGC AG-212-F23]|nr:hypothetical protein AYO45_04770 [Gammaproteobacteria bacterium SCGC AG-212-F23]
MNAIVKTCRKHGELTTDKCRMRIRQRVKGDVIHYECQQCARDSKKIWVKNNPEKILEQYKNRYIIRDASQEILKCSTCKENKCLRYFYKSQHNFKSPRCKICMRISISSYYFKNKEKYKEINRAYNEKFRDQVRIRNHKSKLKNVYNMTLEQYSEILIAQNNVCGICKKPETMKHKKFDYLKLLSVDHCHKTRKVRGLLCDKCNKALGIFEDSVEILESAIKYLKKYMC